MIEEIISRYSLEEAEKIMNKPIAIMLDTKGPEYRIRTFKNKYDKETKELISREKEAYSEYDKRDKVVYKVVEEEEPTQPETTQPETTEPTQPETTEPTQPETTEPAPTDPPIEGDGIGEATG